MPSFLESLLLVFLGAAAGTIVSIWVLAIYAWVVFRKHREGIDDDR